MKTPLLPLLLLSILALHPGARAGDEPKEFSADLNGDGRLQKISTKRAGSSRESGTFYQVIVKDNTGAVLWKSPETKDPENPLAFGAWDYGSSLPELVADLDGDGRAELIVPSPQSDVSPTVYRVFKWTGRAFAPAFARALTGPGDPGGAFRWTESPREGDFWVQEWLGRDAAGWKVELVSLRGGSDVRRGRAVLKQAGAGFELARWTQPPAGLAPGPEAPPTRPPRSGGPGGPPPPPGAPQGGGGYRARLSAADHVSSAGVSLQQVGEILRQDRANVHRGTHRDPEDQVDGRFAAKEARELFSSLPVTVRGGRQAETTIIRGTPVVQVQVSDSGINVEVLGP